MTTMLDTTPEPPDATTPTAHSGLACADVEALLADAQDEIARLGAIVEARDMRIEILLTEKRNAVSEAMAARDTLH